MKEKPTPALPKGGCEAHPGPPEKMMGSPPQPSREDDGKPTPALPRR